MVNHPVLVALFLGALCAVAYGAPPHMEGDLGTWQNG